jgi:hypothetical protein
MRISKSIGELAQPGAVLICGVAPGVSPAPAVPKGGATFKSGAVQLRQCGCYNKDGAHKNRAASAARFTFGGSITAD